MPWVSSAAATMFQHASFETAFLFSSYLLHIMFRSCTRFQFGNDTFNKGVLLNAGAREALQDSKDYECLVFHDVDLIPEDDRNLYSCPSLPRHMSVAVDKFNYT